MAGRAEGRASPSANYPRAMGCSAVAVGDRRMEDLLPAAEDSLKACPGGIWTKVY